MRKKTKTKKNKKEILVNVGALESRVAILEEGRLAELHLERDPRIVGNIYKAKIANILPGMEAAFVDAGLPKHAFLTPEDDLFGVYDSTQKEIVFRRFERKPLASLKASQEILVQVNRAAVGGKGARVSTRLALPGRYIVLLLTDPGRIGISRKIESDRIRQRLRKLGEELCPKGCGLILRTEAEGTRRPQIEKDIEFLNDLRSRLLEKAARQSAPALIYEDLSLVMQIIRDYFTRDVDRVLIDSEEVYKNAYDLVERFMPRLGRRVEHYKEERPMFERYGLEDDIERLWHRKVWLKAGGYISIDQTEALCAIDVNTARFTGKAKGGLAGTILQTNLEAADEIARQLRLRDIGGQVAIDFIDMRGYAHRNKVFKAFEEAIARDPAKTRALPISHLGIVEMTRKKHGESLQEKVTEACPTCSGTGRVANPVSVLLQIQRELVSKSKESGAGALVVWTSPQVALLLSGAGSDLTRRLAARLKKPVYVRVKGDDPREYEVSLIATSEVEEQVGLFYAGQKLHCRRLDEEGEVACSEEGYVIEMQRPYKTRAPRESFEVELLKADPAIGLGRATALPKIEEKEAPKPPARTGFRRKGFRRRDRRKAAAAQTGAEAAPAPAPQEAPAPAPVAPPAKETEAKSETRPESDKPKSRRRRRRRPKKSAEKKAAGAPDAPAPPAVKGKEEADSAKAEAASKRSSSRRRRRPRRKKKETPPDSTQAGDA